MVGRIPWLDQMGGEDQDRGCEMLTTVARFFEPWEAHMLCGRLKAEGIPATVTHEFHVWVNWPLSNALGGVKVQVPRNFESAARAIEQSCRDGEFKDELRIEQGDLNDRRCPACGADRYGKRRSFPQIIVSFTLSFLLGTTTPPWTWICWCENCGCEFRL